MKIVLVLSLLVSAAFSATVTPMGKVIDMLKDMELQGEKEKKAEAVQFAAYQQFCEKTEVEKKRIIADSKDKVEVLTAEIEKSGSDAEKLAEEIAGHLAEVESVTAEKEAASKVRETERKDFQAMLKDYTESVDAIGRALKVLKAQAAPALVQLKSLELPEHASRGLNALLSEGSEEQLGEPSYEFQSGGVVAMLQKLEDKFLEERLQLEKDETSKKNAFDLLAATLTRKIEQATKEQQQKEGIKAKKLHDKASASGDLSETKVGLKTDEEYLAELTTTCTKKAADFKDRQKVRAEELVAIQEATKAMSEIAKPALLQEGTSLAQLKQSLPDAAQVIEADFSRMEAETTASEAAAAKEHDAFVQESKLTKAEKSKEVEHKTSSKREKNSELINIKADLEGTQKELSAAESYYEKLKPDCIDAGPTYAERKAQRDQEMKDLKEALEMLEATAA